jgi:tetratricopeptide (TPR) repeat protein
MILAASFAVALSERADASQEGSGDLADLQARAWAELGNAYRLANDLSSSEAALTRALDLSGHGAGDPLLLARIMDLTASLYTDQRRFSEAQRLLDWTHAIYRRQGDRHAAGRALISKGISARVALQPEEGLRLLILGLRQIDAGRDPKLVFLALQGLIGCLVDCGRITAAKALFEASRELHAMFGERFDVIRARWLEGQIAAGLGENESAEQLLREAREGFEGADLPYHAAVVSLDLAAVWLRQGRTAEIKDLVDEMVAIFKARNIHREAIGALLMLKTALHRNQATAVLLQAVAAELRQWEGTSARKSHVPG